MDTGAANTLYGNKKLSRRIKEGMTELFTAS